MTDEELIRFGKDLGLSPSVDRRGHAMRKPGWKRFHPGIGPKYPSQRKGSVLNRANSWPPPLAASSTWCFD
jgi:hypothetical protein